MFYFKHETRLFYVQFKLFPNFVLFGKRHKKSKLKCLENRRRYNWEEEEEKGERIEKNHIKTSKSPLPAEYLNLSTKIKKTIKNRTIILLVWFCKGLINFLYFNKKNHSSKEDFDKSRKQNNKR